VSLSDIMSGAGLAAYAEVGLILFLVSFVAISIWVFSRRNNGEWELARRLPLADEPTHIGGVGASYRPNQGEQP